MSCFPMVDVACWTLNIVPVARPHGSVGIQDPARLWMSALCAADDLPHPISGCSGMTNGVRIWSRLHRSGH